MRHPLACAVALWLCLAAAASAQTFRGTIAVAVTDQQGAIFPGALVKVTSTGTGLTRTVQTDVDGVVIFSELPLGAYDVEIAAQGFQTQTLKGVEVRASATTPLDVKLAAGGVTSAVEVTAHAPLVDSTRNDQGGRIEGAQAAEIPLNGRDFVKLLTLVPGSTGDASGINDSPGSFGLFSINGNRGRSNNYLLDGTDMNDGYRNLPAINEAGVFGTPATVLPIDAVAEFPVLSGVEAEYGRNSGAIVNIVTKSGTNTLTGSAYEYFRDDGMGARNFFNTEPNPKNDCRNNQFGGVLGGPFSRDRTFYFFSYEGQREHGGVPGPARVPTAAAIAAATAANGGVVNPVVKGLLQHGLWPAPNQAPDEHGNNLAGPSRSSTTASTA